MEMILLLKIKKLYKRILGKIKQKILYIKIVWCIKRKKTHFINVTDKDRWIGKTYTLVKLAAKYDLPIATPNNITGNNIRHMARELKINDLKVIICSNNNHRGRRCNIVLCDTGIDDDFIDVAKSFSKCLIGYKYKTE